MEHVAIEEDVLDETISLAVWLTGYMVQLESSNPGFTEKNMEHFLRSYFQRMAEDEVSIKIDEALPGRNNLMIEIAGDETEPELIFICHMDTVPLGEGWDMDPLSGELRDGKLYGRGACDMKAGLACAVSAFTEAANLKHRGLIPHRTLKLIATVDEEGEMCGVEQAIRSGWVSENSYVLDTEPTNGEIQMAHKGRVWFVLEIQGVPAHASTPWKGADAIAAMAEVIAEIRTEVEQLPNCGTMGKSTVCFGQIQGGQQPYVVSDRCRATVDMRLVPPCNTDTAVSLVKKAMETAMQKIPGVKGSWEITGNRPCIEEHMESELMRQLQYCCREVSGTETVVGVFPGYTDTAVIAGMLKNHNCMSYGPGNLALAHKPNEYVEIKDILRCESVLKRLVRQLIFPN